MHVKAPFLEIQLITAFTIMTNYFRNVTLIFKRMVFIFFRSFSLTAMMALMITPAARNDIVHSLSFWLIQSPMLMSGWPL